MRAPGTRPAPLAPVRGAAGLRARRWLGGAAVILLVHGGAGVRAHAQPLRPQAVLAAPRAHAGRHPGASAPPVLDRPRPAVAPYPALSDPPRASRGRRIGRLFGLEVRLAPAVPWSDGRGHDASAREPAAPARR